jgi:DNA-binding MarR family transcriptional regulator
MQDPLAKYPGYVLRRASARALAELNERLLPLSLRHADVALLMLLNSSPGISQSQAGRMLDIQRANMVPFIARLEKLGLIERQQIDGRSRALKLTRVGCATQADARRIVDAYETELLQRVPAEMRSCVLPVLMSLWGEEFQDIDGSTHR